MRQKEMRMATWNVGSLTGKAREIVDVMQRRKINILCLQEMKWIGESAREIGDGYKLIYNGGKQRRNGVGVILDPELKEAVADVIRHGDRLIAVKLVIHYSFSLLYFLLFLLGSQLHSHNQDSVLFDCRLSWYYLAIFHSHPICSPNHQSI